MLLKADNPEHRGTYVIFNDEDVSDNCLEACISDLCPESNYVILYVRDKQGLLVRGADGLPTIVKKIGKVEVRLPAIDNTNVSTEQVNE